VNTGIIMGLKTANLVLRQEQKIKKKLDLTVAFEVSVMTTGSWRGIFSHI